MLYAIVSFFSPPFHIESRGLGPPRLSRFAQNTQRRPSLNAMASFVWLACLTTLVPRAQDKSPDRTDSTVPYFGASMVIGVLMSVTFASDSVVIWLVSIRNSPRMTTGGRSPSLATHISLCMDVEPVSKS